MLLSQVLPSMAKRGIKEFGTLWKWIARTHDQVDLITVQYKIDDLIQNNNNQFVFNSNFFMYQELIILYIKNPIITNHTIMKNH